MKKFFVLLLVVVALLSFTATKDAFAEEVGPAKKAPESSVEKSVDKANDKAGDKANDKASDKANDKASDKASDKANDKANDKAGDKAGDKANDKAGDKASDKASDKTNDKAGDKPGERTLKPGYMDHESYTGLLNDTMLGKRAVRKTSTGGISFGRTNVFGEIRYHYAINGGSERFSDNSSGFRTYLTFDTKVNEKWRAVIMMEMQNDIKNYNNIFEPLQRWYLQGKLGLHTISMGSFGYLMADGNIYDSGFTGVRSVFGGPVKYTLAYGKTNDTVNTGVFTAKYYADNYDLEAGLYNYEFRHGFWPKNTIVTLGGKYHFENFSLGGIFLNSSEPDTNGNKNGYVLSFDYGDLKTWRKGTYGIYCRYYDQPRGTYISHGMNGRGNSMRGFKGFGTGVGYTLAPNILLNVEYYDLEDKITGENSSTWWNSVSFYF